MQSRYRIALSCFYSKGVIKTNKIYLRPSLQISSFYIQRNLTRKYHTTVQPPGVTGNKYKTVYNFNYIIIFSKPCTQKSSMNQQRKPTTSFTLYLTTIFRQHSFAQYQSIQCCVATRNAHIICTSITSLQQSIMCCGGNEQSCKKHFLCQIIFIFYTMVFVFG